MKLRFASAALEGQTVTLTASQGGMTAGPVTKVNWGAPTMPDGGIITITPHRTTLMVAPDSVGFMVDLSQSNFDTPAPANALVYDRQFHELEYYWTFGDPGEFLAPENVLPAHKNRNFSYGPFVRHLYRAPGSYTVTLMVVEPSSGKVATTETIVTIADPNVVFPGNRTILVNAVGDSDFSESPVAGAQTINAAEILDSGPVMAAVDAVGATTPCRVLIKKGWQGRFGVDIRDWGTAGISWGSYGATGTPPLLQQPAGGLNTNRVFGLQTNTPPPIPRKDFRVYDIDSAGGFDETTTIAPGTDAGNFIWGTGAFNYIAHNVRLSGFGLSTIIIQGGPDFGRILHVDDSRISNMGGQYPIFLGPLNRPDTWTVLTGLHIVKGSDALDEPGLRALMRDNHSPLTHVRGCDMFQKDNSQPCLKLMDTTVARGAKFNVCTSSFEGVGLDVIKVAHNSSQSSETNASLVNGLIDSCVLVGGYRTSSIVGMNAGGVTVRNNLMIQPNMPFLTNDHRAFVNIANAGNNPEIANYPTRVYSNTFVGLRTAANNNNTIPLDVRATDASNAVVDPAGFGIVSENNIRHMPNLAIPEVAFTPLDASDVLWPPRNTGYTNPAFNPITTNPAYASPANSIASYAPLSGSAAVGTALTGLVSERDLGAVERPAFASKGAWEMPVN